MYKKKGNALVEYALIFVAVGLVFGASLAAISPDVFKNLLKSSFETTSSTENDSTVTIGPITE